MRYVHEAALLEELAFARKAAEHFARCPKHNSYGPLDPGSFLALRWGLDGDCVVVLKLDEFHVATNYAELIRIVSQPRPEGTTP
jgi:hypothetical protein